MLRLGGYAAVLAGVGLAITALWVVTSPVAAAIDGALAVWWIAHIAPETFDKAKMALVYDPFRKF